MNIHDLFPEINGFKYINPSPSLTLCLFLEIGGFKVATKARVAYEVQPFFGAEEASSCEDASRVAIDSSLMAVNTNWFRSPTASTSRSRKRRNRKARLELCRGFATAKRVIPALVREQAIVGVLSDFPKVVVAVGGLNEVNYVASPNCSSFGDDFAAVKRVILALVGEQAVVGVLSDFPKVVVAIGILKEMNSFSAPDCFGSHDVSAWLSVPASPSLERSN